LTEYRALTQGGCIAGSQTFTDSGTFTAPSGVTKVKTVCSTTNYFSVTPGRSYKIDTEAGIGDDGSACLFWRFNGTRLGPVRSGGENIINLTVSWSNTINQS
jgi:hypothetical protein